MSLDANQPKPRKRAAAKTPGRPDGSKVKLTLYVPAELAKRFAIHAVSTDMDRSTLFAEMIRETCKRFVVSDRAKGPDGGAEAAAG